MVKVVVQCECGSEDFSHVEWNRVVRCKGCHDWKDVKNLKLLLRRFKATPDGEVVTE